MGSFDLLYLFLSFLFLEPEYPPQATEICSAKGFYKKLQMTHGRAESWVIFKPWARSDTLSTHPSAPSPGREHSPKLSSAGPTLLLGSREARPDPVRAEPTERLGSTVSSTPFIRFFIPRIFRPLHAGMVPATGDTAVNKTDKISHCCLEQCSGETDDKQES